MSDYWGSLNRSVQKQCKYEEQEQVDDEVSNNDEDGYQDNHSGRDIDTIKDMEDGEQVDQYLIAVLRNISRYDS